MVSMRYSFEDRMRSGLGRMGIRGDDKDKLRCSLYQLSGNPMAFESTIGYWSIRLSISESGNNFGLCKRGSENIVEKKAVPIIQEPPTYFVGLIKSFKNSKGIEKGLHLFFGLKLDYIPLDSLYGCMDIAISANNYQ